MTAATPGPGVSPRGATSPAPRNQRAASASGDCQRQECARLLSGTTSVVRRHHPFEIGQHLKEIETLDHSSNHGRKVGVLVPAQQVSQVADVVICTSFDAFIALWEWNDAWAAASPRARRDYDCECDVAFQGDLALNVNISGRHRLDGASSWHHPGAWEADRPETIDAAIRGHERAADFRFTTSRHFLGRRRPLADLLASPSQAGS